MATYLVVAKYTEDVSWLAKIPEDVHIHVYDKGPGGSYENIGREAETYARFLVDMYDTLRPEDVVYFVQGHPFDHCPELLDYFDLPLSPQTTHLGVLLSCDGHGNPHHPGLPIREKHALLFSDTPTTWEFVAGAQYRVPGSHILMTPHATYARVHRFIVDGTICPWTMERLWPRFFL